MEKGTLFIVATPIGNLEDITLRAIRTLKEVDLIACEDTRVSRKLLSHFDIRKPLISLHQHSNDADISKLVDQLIGGKNIAYITDGGTPGISDPGTFLVKKVQETNIKISDLGLGLGRDEQENKQVLLSTDKQANSKSQISEKLKAESYKLEADVIPIPGPSALAAAVSVSGMIDKEFYFAGFLPKKKGRQTKFNQLKDIKVPIVIYESALRLGRTLKDIEKYFGQDAEVFIAREMTKMFEEYWGGKVSEVLTNLADHKLKGEIVLIVKQVS